MHLTYRTVNEAFSGLVSMLQTGDIPTERSPSRAGDVAYITEPVIVTYTHPRERVLLNPERDANPFFHLFESLWMLAGRNDVAPLAYYNSRMSEFSDDGRTFNGAYGFRWRHAFVSPDADPPETWHDEIGMEDQLGLLINHLKENPNSRRAVLQMWNVEDDLLKIDSSLDVCCNLSACFSVRHTQYDGPEGQTADFDYLDLTVFNRSNDLIWGMLGANVVHFSFLQEYMAAHLGLEVGVYNQVSNNLHYYVDRWEGEKWLANNQTGLYKPYTPVSLVEEPEMFDREVKAFVDVDQRGPKGVGFWKEPFLESVCEPMCQAFHAHKQRKYESAFGFISYIDDDAWRMAAAQWMANRRLNFMKKMNGVSND